jgi:Transposase DDE domain group 1
VGKIGRDRQHKIDHDGAAIERLFVDVFLDAHDAAPARIVIDLDATDSTLYGEQEGRHFNGYYDSYCYLPLYIFCGRHLLAAKLRTSSQDAAAGSVAETARIVAHIRTRWPTTTIVIRADSGFCRDELLVWCEANDVQYVIGLAGNPRLLRSVAPELAKAEKRSLLTGAPARVFKDFRYATLDSWSCERRVIGKAEWTKGEANPRFIVTNIHTAMGSARHLYEDVYCQRPCEAWLRHDARWKIGSRNVRATCSPTARRRPPCAPINCGCGSPPSPTCSCVHCVGWDLAGPRWRARRAGRSAWHCSKSARSSPSVCGA